MARNPPWSGASGSLAPTSVIATTQRWLHALLLGLLACGCSATDFTPPSGTVVSKTNGMLATGAALYGLSPATRVDPTYHSTILARRGIVVYLGDATDDGSRKCLFLPVSVYPDCCPIYERWGGEDGPVLTVTYQEYLRLGGKPKTVYGSSFTQFIGAKWVDGLVAFYSPVECYRLAESFPPSYPMSSVEDYIVSNRWPGVPETTSTASDQELFCSLIPGVNLRPSPWTSTPSFPARRWLQ